MRTLPPRPRGAAGTPPPPAIRGLPGRQGLTWPVRRPGREPRAAPTAADSSQRLALLADAVSALDRTAKSVATLLPPRARRWLLRAAGASAGTIGLLGLVITAEALRVRSHAFLPETVYDRILRFPSTAEFGGTPLKLAVLGDSTTTGIGTERVEETYAALVGQALAARGAVEVHVLGRAGSRLADVIAEQLPLARALRPDLILLVAGANDATHVTPLVDVRTRTRRMLGELAGTPLVLAGVPRLSLARVVAFPLRELSRYRGIRVTAMMRRCARHYPDVHFVSLSMRPAGLDGVPRAWLSTDRFHPSAYGYAQWATAFIPALLAADPRAPSPVPEPRMVTVRGLAASVSGMPAPAGVAVSGGIVPRAPIVVAWQALRRRLRRVPVGRVPVGGAAAEPAAEAAAG